MKHGVLPKNPFLITTPSHAENPCKLLNISIKKTDDKKRAKVFFQYFFKMKFFLTFLKYLIWKFGIKHLKFSFKKGIKKVILEGITKKRLASSLQSGRREAFLLVPYFPPAQAGSTTLIPIQGR
ncbi:MAG: hypothetical protein MI742_02485 [Desulfobacterales bacterium]|nr:hypothetical protein [Desulfobacterales bacterium]